MLYQKPATTIDDQLRLLRDRGMGWADETLVRRWLETVGYYRLSIYWYPMEVGPMGSGRSHQFAPETRFEDVVHAYVFDRKLRLLVLEATERVEIGVRARWTNRFGLAHGAHGYVDSSLFVSARRHERKLGALTSRFAGSNELFVRHYKDRYSDGPDLPPLWMATELMSFGDLSKWFELTRSARIKKAVALDVGLPAADLLASLLKCLNYVRNVCAHHARLWNRSLTFRPPLVRRLDDDLVRDPASPTELSDRIYNVLVLLAHVLRTQSPETSWPNRVTVLVAEETRERLLAMGFPDDWQSKRPWG